MKKHFLAVVGSTDLDDLVDQGAKIQGSPFSHNNGASVLLVADKPRDELIEKAKADREKASSDARAKDEADAKAAAEKAEADAKADAEKSAAKAKADAAKSAAK